VCVSLLVVAIRLKRVTWDVVEAAPLLIPSKKAENYLDGTLFLNDIYLNYSDFTCTEEVHRSSHRIKFSSISVVKGNSFNGKNQIQAQEGKIILALRGIGDGLIRNRLDVFTLILSSNHDVHLRALEFHNKISPFKSIEANDLKNMKADTVNYAFSARLPGDGDKHKIVFELSNHSVKKWRPIEEMVLIIESGDVDAFIVQLDEISFQDHSSQLRAFYPGINMFKRRKQWIKSVFLPGNSRIAYNLKADKPFHFDGYLGALPGESPHYCLKANGKIVLSKQVATEYEYFHATIEPEKGLVNLEISTMNSSGFTGVLGNFSFYYESKHEENIIFYLVDALRGDFGGVQENGFEHYFKDGAIFKKAYSNSSWTGDSLPVVFSGKYKCSLVMDQLNHPNFPEEEFLLAEFLKKRGYTTAAFITNSFLIKNNAQQGFDFVDLCWDLKKTTPFPSVAEYKAFKYGNMENSVRNFVMENAGKKLFIFVHTLETHQPYELPKSWRIYSQEIDEELLKSVFGNIHHFLFQPSEAQVKTVRSLYKDSVVQAFRFFKGMMQMFEENKISNKNSLLVFTSDHGERLFEHGHWGHGRPDLYNEVLHVPLMIRGRGIRPGVYANNVQLADLFPTIMDWLGDEKAPWMVGDSIVNDLHHKTSDKDERIIYVDGAHRTDQFCVIVKNMKMILTGEQIEVYDLNQDPGETVNLAEESRFKELLQSALRFRKSHEKSGRLRDLNISREELERLKSLGYIH
jgi:choline-sulfatase